MRSMIRMKVVKADTEELRLKAFDIRKEVFVVEQKVSTEDEFDEFESACYHFVALDDVDNPIGAARWRVTEKGVKLERFAVKSSWRGKGVGSALVQCVIDDIKAKKGRGQYLYLHAQLTAVSLYAKFGFEKVGDQFEECNIQHYKMQSTS